MPTVYDPRDDPRYNKEPIFLALLNQESKFNPNAVSPTGARGYGQLLKSTVTDPGFGITPNPAALTDPEQNVSFAYDYFNKMKQRYGGDTDAALVAYNGGPGKADEWTKSGKDDSLLSPETRNYYKKVGRGFSNTAPTLTPAPTPSTNTSSLFPERIQALGDKDPSAFIFHHTAGRGDVDSVKNTLKQRGLGVQYVMDRDGTIFATGVGGASHIRNGQGEKGKGLSNANVVGMEIIAKDDKDITPAQVAAATKFIATRYPTTPVFGHGEINTHKQETEGATVKQAVESFRLLSPEEQTKFLAPADTGPTDTTAVAESSVPEDKVAPTEANALGATPSTDESAADDKPIAREARAVPEASSNALGGGVGSSYSDSPPPDYDTSAAIKDPDFSEVMKTSQLRLNPYEIVARPQPQPVLFANADIDDPRYR